MRTPGFGFAAAAASIVVSSVVTQRAPASRRRDAATSGGGIMPRLQLADHLLRHVGVLRGARDVERRPATGRRVFSCRCDSRRSSGGSRRSDPATRRPSPPAARRRRGMLRPPGRARRRAGAAAGFCANPTVADTPSQLRTARRIREFGRFIRECSPTVNGSLRAGLAGVPGDNFSNCCRRRMSTVVMRFLAPARRHGACHSITAWN